MYFFLLLLFLLINYYTFFCTLTPSLINMLVKFDIWRLMYCNTRERREAGSVTDRQGVGMTESVSTYLLLICNFSLLSLLSLQHKQKQHNPHTKNLQTEERKKIFSMRGPDHHLLADPDISGWSFLETELGLPKLMTIVASTVWVPRTRMWTQQATRTTTQPQPPSG